MVNWGAHHQHDQNQKQQQQGWRKGPWTPEEDKLLMEYVTLHGEGRWSSVAKCAGLNRSGKSCRLRWVNYLRPGLKRGQITPQEEGIIIELHALWGNKWSTIARYLPGRTDNEIKNYWRTHFKKKDRSSSKQEHKIKKSQSRKSRQQPQLQPQPQPQPQVCRDDTKLEPKLDIPPFISQSNITSTTTARAATVFMEDQYHHNNMSHYTTTIASCSSDLSMIDEGYLWGSLWNLDDDPQGFFGGGQNVQTPGVSGNSNVNKVMNVDAQQSIQHLLSGDYSNDNAFYTGGFNF